MSKHLQQRIRNVVAQVRAEAWPLSVMAVALLVGILGLRSKVRVMSPRWSSIARWLGHNDARELSPLQRLDFFCSDLAFAFLIVPALALALFALLPCRYRFGCTAFACALLLALTHFHTVSHQVIGQYLSWELITEAVEWGTGNPDTITDYLPIRGLWKLASLICGASALLAMGHLFSSDRRTRLSRGLLSQYPIAGMLLVAGTAATALFISVTEANQDIRRTPLHESALWSMTKTLLSGGNQVYSPTRGVSYLEATREFRKMTGSDLVSSIPELVGSMKHANVVVFVVETGPMRVLDLRGEAGSWDGISGLLKQSLVAGDHLTTHPYTSDAVFSMLSGLYPSGRRQFLRHWHAGEAPGLFTALRSIGYATAAFTPTIFTRELDEKMYRAFGIEEIHNVAVNPDRDSMALAPSYVEQAQLWTVSGDTEDKAFDGKLRTDAKALAELMSYIEGRRNDGRPFAVIYLPQASHAPWHGRGTVQERGLLQMKLQAIALDGIVEKLATLGELDNTIIVFTADHGIRTKIEDPSLNTGSATPYMFQTPLMIFAPRALSEPMQIGTPTSHVDIVPTVLGLLGHPEAGAIGVGVPIWEATSDRRIYFLAEGYAGFNGFVERGEYFQFHMMTDQAHGPSGSMDFDRSAESDRRSASTNRVRRTLGDYAESQSKVIGGLMASAKPIAAGDLLPVSGPTGEVDAPPRSDSRIQAGL